MQIIQKQKTNLFKFKFHECLAIVQQAAPQLFSPGLKVTEEYGVSRSFRRGGTSKATPYDNLGKGLENQEEVSNLKLLQMPLFGDFSSDFG
jgi:hypothetical protein